MNAANTITILRLFAVIPFTIFLASKNYTLALIFFVFAALSDIADGYIARKFDQKTRLGGFLDPLADKLLVFAGNLILVMQGVIPLWFFIFILLKDLSILLGVILLRSKDIEWEPAPNRAGKAEAFFKAVIIIIGILHQGFFDTGPVIIYAIILCLLFILFSWFHYYSYYSSLTKKT